MRRGKGLSPPLVIAFFISLIAIGLMAPAASGAEVVGNPELIRYEGSGGLVLPSSVDRDTRTEVAGCRGCSWKITAACVPDADNYCDAAIRGCPGLIDHVRTWFRPNGGQWRETGLICLSSQSVTTLVGIEGLISESFYQYVPDLKPLCWPESGPVVNIPLLCGSGQAGGTQEWSENVSGFAIEITAKPQWAWNFERDYITSNVPGGPYPDMSVTHTYKTSGTKQVLVETRWRGMFSVDGLGPFPIERELRQVKGFEVEIGQARARLMRPNA